MLEEYQSTDQYSIEICTDRSEWNSFIERSNGPVYNRWCWSEAVASYGHERWHFVARDRDEDAIAAALPLYHVESRLFGSKLLSPAFAERGSIVSIRGERSSMAKQLLLEQTKALADSLGVDYVSLRGGRVTESADFTLKNRYVTFQVPVDRGTEAVWSDIQGSRQRQINQAAADDSLRFETGDSLDDLRAYYRLYLETMHRHGSPPHSFEFFKTLWDQLYESGDFCLSLILHDDSVINGMIDLSLGSTVYQWGVVSDYEQRDLNGGSLLHWKSLERASENGNDTYEFGRTREGSGVYMFKKSFGGTKVWYDDIHYFPDGTVELPDPDKTTYERASEIWKRLPLPVTRVVGPQLRKQLGI